MLLTLVVVLLCSGLVNLYFSTQILRRVSIASTDVQVNFWELRWQVHKYMKKYCQLTREESGRIGFSWYGYWGSLIVLMSSLIWLLVTLSTP